MTHKKHLEYELDELHEYKSKGPQIRTRAKQIDEGEKKHIIFSKA